jgi:hypothetical protein
MMIVWCGVQFGERGNAACWFIADVAIRNRVKRYCTSENACGRFRL